MTMDSDKSIGLFVRTGKGHWVADKWETRKGEVLLLPFISEPAHFTDAIEYIERVPTEHKGWDSVVYKGLRYSALYDCVSGQCYIVIGRPIPTRAEKIAEQNRRWNESFNRSLS